MPPADAMPYEVIEREPFLTGWAAAIGDGELTEELGRFLARLRRVLARDPHRFRHFAGLPVDTWAVTYDRRFIIWYCVVEDDRTVYLEALEPVPDELADSA